MNSKIYLSVFELFLSWWIMSILSKGCKPDNFESHNSLRFSFTNIWGLRWNSVECKFFLESNFLDILALCETNLDDSVDSGNIFVRGHLLLIWKDSITHMHVHVVYVKGGPPFACGLSLKNLVDSYLTVTLKALLFWISFFWYYYLFYNGFPSIGKFWSCSCLSFHWLSVKIKMECPVSLQSFWLFFCWLGWSLWSFERCLMGRYPWTQYFVTCFPF